MQQKSMKMPSVIGTYSPAFVVDNTIYLSGQIPLNPDTMELISQSPEDQIEQVLKNLSALCESYKGSLAKLVKITVYLTDLQYFQALNLAMARYFEPPYPARAVIQVVALPKGAQIEIDGIMVL